jgi:hypothetical protein
MEKNMVNQSGGNTHIFFAGGDLEGNSVNPPETMVDVGMKPYNYLG